jgi:signal transduction histidine kinase
VRNGGLDAILAALNRAPGIAALYVPGDRTDDASATVPYPHLLILPRQDGWLDTLILVAIEALRRMEAVERAKRAERQAILAQGYATLGRYMLEMRPSVNNALTSVLGNADLLLLEPGQASLEMREQIQVIQTMALRLNEIVQRFSSLAAQVRAGEKESQAETDSALQGIMSRR